MDARIASLDPDRRLVRRSGCYHDEWALEYDDRNRLVESVSAASLTGALVWQDVMADRTLTAAGFDRLRAQFNSNAWSGRIEGGCRFAHSALASRPMPPAGYDVPAVDLCRAGSNNLALAYASRKQKYFLILELDTTSENQK